MDKTQFTKSAIACAVGLALALVLGGGCASQESYLPKCRQRALLTSSVVADHHPMDNVRIAYGSLGGMRHVQSQVLINGKWHWLKLFRDGTVSTGMKHRNFRPVFFISLKDYYGMSLYWNRRVSKKREGGDRK